MSKLIVSTIETQNVKFDSDTTAFTIGSDGVLSGTGSPAMVKLLNATWSTTISAYDVTSTYINSTYDTYYITWRFAPTSDSVNLMLRFFHDGAVDTGNNYGWETTNTFTNTTLTSNAGGGINLCLSYSGNATGEHINATFNGTHSILIQIGNFVPSRSLMHKAEHIFTT